MAVPIGGVGQPREPDGGLLAEPRRGFWIDSHGAQLSHQSRQGQRSLRPAQELAYGCAELSQESGRLVRLTFGTCHCGHDQPGPGAGARDVEEPPLLRNPARAGNWRQHLVAPQPIGLQQRAAAAYVWPTALLNPRDDDQVPLQPLGAMGRENTDRRPPKLGLSQWIGRNLLTFDLRQETRHSAEPRHLLRPRGDLE
jgi:hypothetical protein